MEPKVSVMTTSYNQKAYIGKCIESVIAQTHKNWEMVIVDDASTDGTPELVKKYQENEPRIKFIEHKENYGYAGLAATFNDAFNASDGQFIMILEADDYAIPERMEKQLKCFERKEVVLSHGDCFLINSKNKIFGEKRLSEAYKNETLFNSPKGSALKAFFVYSMPMINPTMMVKRDALEAIGGFIQPEGLKTADFITNMHLAMQGEFCYLNQKITYYRKYPESLTASPQRTIQSVEAASKYMLNEFFVRYKERIEEFGIPVNKYIEYQKKAPEFWKKAINYSMGKENIDQGNYAEAEKYFYKHMMCAQPDVRTALSVIGWASSKLKVNVYQSIINLAKQIGIHSKV